MLDFDRAGGLVPAIAQDADTGQVLMIAWMNREGSPEESHASPARRHWSRSRQKLWRKGEESGNVQMVRDLFVDCDQDAVLLKVTQVGGAGLSFRGYPSLRLSPRRGECKRSDFHRRAACRSENVVWQMTTSLLRLGPLPAACSEATAELFRKAGFRWPSPAVVITRSSTDPSLTLS